VKHQKQLSNLEKLRTIIQENEQVDDVDLFFSNVAADFDDYLNQEQSVITANQRLSIKGFWLGLKNWHEKLDEGPIPKDPLILNFIDHVNSIGAITKNQLRVIRRYALLRRNENGLIEVNHPTIRDAFISVFLIVVLVGICVFSGGLILSKISFGQDELFFYYPLGALLGYCIRAAYDFYWGRLSVSKLLQRKFYLR
jgi:hypothetical protein